MLIPLSLVDVVPIAHYIPYPCLSAPATPTSPTHGHPTQYTTHTDTLGPQGGLGHLILPLKPSHLNLAPLQLIHLRLDKSPFLLCKGMLTLS